MLRTLTHYWRVNLAVALGAAVATAVLGGALLVGDSVRGSLRDLTLERLGEIDRALVAQRFQREDLADALVAAGVRGAAPAIVMRGSATQPDEGRRASRVTIVGFDERFVAAHGAAGALDLDPRAESAFAPVVLNEALARELGVGAGGAILLHFPRASEIPRETLMGETDTEDVLARVRATVAAVIPDHGVGRFGLVPTQSIPLNAFVPLPALQRALDRRGQGNAIVVPRGGADPDAALAGALALEDLGLTLTPRDGFLALGSREFVLRPEVDRALDAVVARLGVPLMRTQSYLANTIRRGDRVVPYALVAALDPLVEAPWGRLTLTGGADAPDPLVRSIGDGEILLNTWAATDLGAAVGDTLALRYFAVGSDETLTEKETSLRIAGVVEMVGLAADRSLTPHYPGIQEARDMAAWDPPFPVDLDLIRPRDEEYWDEHGATPKAFVSAATGRALWSTRFGSTTAARIGVPPGMEAPDLEARLRAALLQALPPAAVGLTFRPVREEGLRAAAGATDFSMLFASFSVFIIASAGLLVGLLFRLGVEQRAGEIGLLLALGYRVRDVRRRLLAEGLALALAGGVVGVVVGVGYAWLMMAGLRTLWRPAVGTSELFLHVGPWTLPIGLAISVLVVLGSIGLAVRRLVREAPQRLLSGAVAAGARARRGRLAPSVAVAGTVLGLGAAVYAGATGATNDPALAFGSGASLLLAGLAFFALWCRRPGRGGLGRAGAGLAGMAARNSAWNPGRSVLSAALVASACFVLVLVGASTGADHDLERKESGSGGYALVAEADIGLHQDLDRREGLLELGFGSAAADELARARVTAFRMLPGDDASCLNLYRPERPSILGAPPEFIERNAFTFARHLELPAGEDNPWRLLERPLEPGVVPAIADFNSATWILHVGLGGDLPIQNERGESVRLRLVGLLERSVIQSEILIAEASFLAHFPGRTGRSYFLVDAPAGEAGRIADLLESGLGPFGFDATTTRDKLAGYRAVEDTYIATFQALGALGLLLGTAGLGVVLLRNVIERRGELAVLRAFGFRRSRLAWLVLGENAFLLLVGVGVGSAAAVVAAAPNLAGGHVPWASLALTLGSVWAVGMLSSVLAVRGTLRAPLLGALKEER